MTIRHRELEEAILARDALRRAADRANLRVCDHPDDEGAAFIRATFREMASRAHDRVRAIRKRQ